MPVVCPCGTSLMALQGLFAGQFSPRVRLSVMPRWGGITPTGGTPAEGPTRGTRVQCPSAQSTPGPWETCFSVQLSGEASWVSLRRCPLSHLLQLFTFFMSEPGISPFPQTTKWHMSGDLEAFYPLLLGLSRKKERPPPFLYAKGKEKSYSTLATFSLNATERQAKDLNRQFIKRKVYKEKLDYMSKQKKRN